MQYTDVRVNVVSWARVKKCVRHGINQLGQQIQYMCKEKRIKGLDRKEFQTIM